jgi:hypothetical protein
MFIMAVAVQLPAFSCDATPSTGSGFSGGTAVGGRRDGARGCPALTGGCVNAERSGALLLSSVLTLVGVILVLHAFAGVIRGGVRPATGWGTRLPATMAVSLVLALALNVAACVELARGAIVVPFAQDEAVIHLELWGFASTMVLAVSGRAFPKFLLLQPSYEGCSGQHSRSGWWGAWEHRRIADRGRREPWNCDRGNARPAGDPSRSSQPSATWWPRDSCCR